ncbi:MAG TPA: T9SS type A sorting domain-containing protein [Bacteroidia bacterium]
MKKILLPFIAYAFLSATSLHAQLTDTLIHTVPSPPTLPAAGNTFTDATFGTALMRVTDASDGNDNHHAYSYWQCMNKNSTQLYVMQTQNIGATLYDFNSTNFTIANKRAAFASNCSSGIPPDAECAIWSDLDSTIIFVHDRNMHLYSYNVVSQSYTLIKDFTASFTAGEHSWQMNKNHTDDDLFTFTWKDASWNVGGVFAWRKSTNQLYTYAQPDADECQPDRAGHYLIIKLTGSGQNTVQGRIVNLSTGVIKDITDGGPANPNTPGLFWAPGHGDMGNGTAMGHDNWNNRLVGRTCTAPDSFYTVQYWWNDWSQDYHGSSLADDGNWITLIPYAVTTPNTGYYLNEILQVSTDGQRKVKRLAHHHTDFIADYNANGGNNAYWSSPKASISKDGKWVVFTSNWGSTTRKDVFVLKIPQPTTSVQNVSLENNTLNVYPNPASNVTTIDYNLPDGANQGDIVFYNLQGLEVKRYKVDKAFSSLLISTNDIAAGTYFYQLQIGGNASAAKKMVVVK